MCKSSKNKGKSKKLNEVKKDNEESTTINTVSEITNEFTGDCFHLSVSDDTKAPVGSGAALHCGGGVPPNMLWWLNWSWVLSFHTW